MLRTLSVIFGLIFLIVGILGFVPALTPEGYLLGLFHVNTIHNIVHILSGLVFIIAGIVSFVSSQVMFRIFGCVYLLVAILGFFYGDQPILGFLSNNMADTWLHLVLSIVILYLGFRRWKVKRTR